MTTLIENIKADYLNWTARCADAKGCVTLSETNKKMIAEFDEGISYKAGSKYIKITRERNGVWGFVVNTDNDKKFKKGDIQKFVDRNGRECCFSFISRIQKSICI